MRSSVVSQILKTKTHGKLFSVYSGSIVNEAVRLLSSERIGSVVVLDKNEALVGIAAAAIYVHKDGPNRFLLIVASDHMMPDVEAFQLAIMDGASVSALVVFKSQSLL